MISETVRPNRVFKLFFVMLRATHFNAHANRARQRKKGPVVRRGRRYP